MKKLSRIYKFLLLCFPAILFFSYFPVISLGSDESMNFELSLPLIWLVVFDIVAIVMMGVRKKLGCFIKKWPFLFFPIFASLSILWSSNILRGVLTGGIIWAIYIAVFASMILRDEVGDLVFRNKMLKVFFGASVVVCAWCLIQCVLDLVGVSREYSLMCEGCTSYMFGFPHPNGFAIEPQFMGNLLLAPAIVVEWLYIKQGINNLELRRSRGDNFYNGAVGVRTKLQFRDSLRDRCKNHSGSLFLGSRLLILYFFIFIATIFLTFSRGAIYAFAVATVFFTTFILVKAKKKGWGKMWKKVGTLWITIILSFIFTLNLQGIMAEVGPTNDTYGAAIAKVLNHLSLGIIDIRQKPVDVPVESDVLLASTEVAVEKEEAVFDGYVVESTEVRKMMTDNALSVWRSSFKNVMLGVGLGGAGKAMQEAGLISNANEIVQNQYVSLLLEVGIVGVGLLIALLIMILKLVIKVPINSLLLTLFVAYGISLCFFAGLPNALHIYLIPGLLYLMLDDKLIVK